MGGAELVEPEDRIAGEELLDFSHLLNSNVKGSNQPYAVRTWRGVS
jgi:hypothetical protein